MKMFEIIRKLTKEGVVTYNKVNGVTVIEHIRDYKSDRHIKNPALMLALIEALHYYYKTTVRPNGYFGEVILVHTYNGKTIHVIY